ncbi:MAG: dienelactone hydrolase family protein [Chloroflexota bacterium]
MAEVLLFHHALGLTQGVLAFAGDLRTAGHTVHTPDLYDGNTFPDVGEGVGYARQVGFETIMERGQRSADALPPDLIYAGFSLGVLSAQMLAQNRPGAKGALFMYACMPAEEFGSPWPDIPLQIHGMDADQSFATEGDLDAARELVANATRAELFLYPGNQHLFADSSTPDYDESAAALLKERVISFLAANG